MSDARPRLDQINLVTTNTPESVKFYRLLGLDIPEAPPDWDPHHRSANLEDGSDIDLDIDSTAFSTIWGSEDIPTGALIGFRVTSRAAVDSLHAKLTAAGHRSLRAPYDAFWGIRYAIVEDPDGTAVGIMSAPSQEHRAPPPDVSALE